MQRSKVSRMVCQLYYGEKMTTQTMDTVYLDGSEYWTYAEPLYSLPGLPKFMAGSTANQRGYDATWSIVADKLFLVALAGTTYNSSERGLAMVFPRVLRSGFCGLVLRNHGYPEWPYRTVARFHPLV